MYEYVSIPVEPLQYDEEYRSEEDVDHQRGKHESLPEPLCHLEPLQALAVIIPHAGSHLIVELADHLYHLRWHSEASAHLSKKCVVDKVICRLQVNEKQ